MPTASARTSAEPVTAACNALSAVVSSVEPVPPCAGVGVDGAVAAFTDSGVLTLTARQRAAPRQVLHGGSSGQLGPASYLLGIVNRARHRGRQVEYGNDGINQARQPYQAERQPGQLPQRRQSRFAPQRRLVVVELAVSVVATILGILRRRSRIIGHGT